MNLIRVAINIYQETPTKTLKLKMQSEIKQVNIT